ncbi:hypothetical protein SKAU_G00172880 [Synaphobranchus kaupii]|uniref:Uncharacterized protein n=1 Tax=Synaphobranchus kaupii TaxID=118154 RepID=A0A9Q1FL28_SYNKA|nr:hypothetical protein SKAU_G00172880 [Synaphobranchus kaupii]
MGGLRLTKAPGSQWLGFSKTLIRASLLWSPGESVHWSGLSGRALHILRGKKPPVLRKRSPRQAPSSKSQPPPCAPECSISSRPGLPASALQHIKEAPGYLPGKVGSSVMKQGSPAEGLIGETVEPGRASGQSPAPRVQRHSL